MGRSTPRARYFRRLAGFTLLEVLVASSILAFATLGLVQAVSAGQSQTYDALRRARATALADALLEEVLAKPYADPESETALGPDSGESGRDDFDNLDDYHGFAETAGTLADHSGALYAERFQRFERSVTISPETVSIAELGGGRSGMRVTVTVTESVDGATGRSWTVTRFVPETP
ncbi:MAG: prepilin-type N-terminal cleavage/methylation domain-containing protein [Phycisphaerales bacterium JB063]